MLSIISLVAEAGRETKTFIPGQPLAVVKHGMGAYLYMRPLEGATQKVCNFSKLTGKETNVDYSKIGAYLGTTTDKNGNPLFYFGDCFA